MEVVSTSPFRVGSMLWQDGTGAATLTVVGKATYFLAPGESPLDQRQDAPFETDEHWDDDENRSLRAASDLAPFKRHADVLLVGHAFAPGRQAVRSLRARLIVGEVDKALEVVCDRALSQDGRLREGASFTKMALRWERAAGGPETTNPAGVRADAPLDRYGQRPLPNLVPVGTALTSGVDFIEPIGFGPMGPSWPARQARLHRGLAGWDYRRWHERPLPPDLDPGFFNAAPVDQQTGAIRPNERLVLENLHPKHPRLTTNLATFTPRAVLEWPGHPGQELRMRCDTLTIDTDRGTCALTWRVAIPLDDPRRVGRVVIMLGRSVEDAGRLHMGTTAELAPKSVQALPFMAPPLARASVPDIALDHETMDTPLAEALPALPFRVGRSPLAGTVLGKRQPLTEPPPPPYVEADADADEDEADEIEPELEEAELEPEIEPEDDAVPEEELTFTVLPDEAAALLDGRAPLPSWIPESRSWPPPPLAAVPTPAPPPPSAPPPAPPPPAPVAVEESPPPPPATPPPLIGPLATPEMVAREQAAAEERASPLAEETVDLPVEPPPPAPEDPGLPLDRYPLERCAAIAASMARRKPETGKILEEHELSPPRWAALSQHWQDAIRAESARGKTRQLDAYDDAYVGQLEAERGPIRVEEYARIVVAAERGSEGAELEALGLPRSALLRVSRVWSRRTAADADLGRAVRDGIEAAREA